jgi:hypothetical protein
MHSQPFQDFANESNHGRQTRFFSSRDDAIAWVESFSPS